MFDSTSTKKFLKLARLKLRTIVCNKFVREPFSRKTDDKNVMIVVDVADAVQATSGHLVR